MTINGAQIPAIHANHTPGLTRAELATCTPNGQAIGPRPIGRKKQPEKFP